MSYTAEQFIEDVKKEARALREHATKEEIAKLSFSELDPEDPWECIYGQLTGWCTSRRASELIFNCCRQYIKNDRMEPLFKSIDEILPEAAGTNLLGVDSVDGLKALRDGPSISHFSAIESYIMVPEANRSGLIDYLKGETDTLDL